MPETKGPRQTEGRPGAHEAPSMGSQAHGQPGSPCMQPGAHETPPMGGFPHAGDLLPSGGRPKARALLSKGWLTTMLSLAIALLMGAVFILFGGNNPIEIYGKLFSGALGSRTGIMQTLLQATPLLFCGLAVSVSMKAGLLNLGVEGQLYMGALAAALVGIYVKGLPAFLHIPLCMLFAMAGGAAWAFLPVWLKIKRGTHEVVTALMMNYIAILFVDYMTNYPLRTKNATVAQSDVLQATAMLPKLVARSQVTPAIIVGMVLAVVLWFMLRSTTLGYQITLVGSNRSASAATGVPVSRIMVITMLISGVCAGLAGGMEVMGTHGRLIQGFSPGYGFDGIAVAVLGASPLSVIVSALLFGALRAGGMALSYGTNMSVKFINALQGVIILLIAAPMLSYRILTAFDRPLRRMSRKNSEGV